MTIDQLSIISFNSSRKGLLSLSPGQRPSYLQSIIEKASPEICFLPGDDKCAKLHVIRGYGQYTVPNAEDTVLLYDTNKVSMTQPKVSLNAFGPMPGMDFEKMVVPDVEVLSLLPNQTVVKHFNMVSWKYDLFETAIANANGVSRITVETLIESIITFSQRLAVTTHKPVLIGGEMKLDFNILMKIVNKLSKDRQEDLLCNFQPVMTEMGYLPSMSKSSLKDLRHLFMLKVFRCDVKRKQELNELRNGQTEVVADCFIASKQLELAEATLLDVEKVTGRQICMKMLTEHKPTQTHMEIPVRPPRHHGG